MPALPRTSARLLRTVRNKQHATEDDHLADAPAHSLPTPPTSSSTEAPMARTAKPTKLVEVEDYMQDPLSSDEEVQPASDLEKLSRPTTTSKDNKRPSVASGSDDDIFGSALSSSQQKRAKTAAFKKPTVRYGSQSSQSRTDAKSGKDFKQAKAVLPSKSKIKESATFKTARGADIFTFGGEIPQMPSPSLSAVSGPDSPGLEEIEVVQDVPKARCDICHEQVDLLLKQEYEDRYSHGQKLNVKRQNAFCRFHKQNDARSIWHQRNYPQINWERLESRMREQHPRLINILQGRKASAFRDELAKQIASREDRTIKTTFGSKPSELSAGYYGPRGQKLMLEHISTQLSDELREASLKNNLISSAGIGGGVSGFVQGVLVPEMAVGLIAVDMDVSDDVARRILVDSRTLGDTLHDEERERIVEGQEP